MNEENTFSINSKNIFKAYNLLEYETKNWPTSTDYHCWWCCYSFSGSPLAIPKSYDQKNETFKVYGNFCSFSCAKAFCLTRKNYEKTCSLLSYLQFKLTGKIKTIKPSPPKEVLKAFGGPLSIKEYRTIEDSNYYLVEPPMMPFNSHIQEEKINEIINLVPKNTSFKIERNQNEIPKKLSKLGIRTIKKQQN